MTTIDLSARTIPMNVFLPDSVAAGVGRISPQAIANAFLYLCSPLADEVDGHILQVDAGVGLPKLG